jgi:hypothetical protein
MLESSSQQPVAVSEQRLKLRADDCVQRLREAVAANPSSWAWVRSLALLSLALPMLSLGGCADSHLMPPLPIDPAAWVASAEDLVWTGELSGAMRARFAAVRAEGHWRDGKPTGRFDDVRIDVWASDTGLKLLEVDARSGRGSWPGGPALFEDVRWTLPIAGEEGQLDSLAWREDQGWSCAGCPLELLAAALRSPDSEAP